MKDKGMDKEIIDFDMRKCSKLADELRLYAVANCKTDQNQKRPVCEVHAANALDRVMKHLTFWLNEYKEQQVRIEQLNNNQLNLCVLFEQSQCAKLITENGKLQAELDAAVNDLAMLKGRKTLCHICEFEDMIRCCHDSQCTDKNLFFKWRGKAEKGNVKSFKCEDCKHLLESEITNRLWCSYHSEGEYQQETYKDDYCSYFGRRNNNG